MTAVATRQSLQTALGVKPDGKLGPITQRAFTTLATLPDDAAWPPLPPLGNLVSTDPNVLVGNGRWPFTARIVGDDLLLEDIVITCFGGANDPQDNGETASGMNTIRQFVRGVSIAMDGRDFSGLSAAEHAALDGAPIPKLRNARGLTAWHTMVEVTIGTRVYQPQDGIVDLGPGLEASHPGDPHALDLTPQAAQFFWPSYSLAYLSRNFKERGSARIIGGAKLIGGRA